MKVNLKCIGIFSIFLFMLIISQVKASDVNGFIKIENVIIKNGVVKIQSVIKNTGSVTHKFPVGCSILKKDEQWIDIPFQIHELKPNQEMKVYFEKEIKEINELVLVRAAIWDHAKEDGLLDTRYAFDEKSIPLF